MAISVLEQMPTITTNNNSEIKVIYYPQVEGITPTVVKAEQEPKTDVLGKIRAEIEKPLREERFFDTANAKAQYIALNWCIEIIDKYREEHKYDDFFIDPDFDDLESLDEEET